MTKLTFISRTDNTTNLTDTVSVNQDTALDSAGKTIGYDNTYVTATNAQELSADAALAVEGGFLYATFTTNDGGQNWSGDVTGGTGNFKGATGKVTATAQSETELEVTVVYG
jgi:hypothetical protein